jgi:hypothetical protein
MTFEVYIDDDRYTVLQLLFVDARDEADAINKGYALLRGNMHYRSVELWTHEAQRVVLQRMLEPRRVG